MLKKVLNWSEVHLSEMTCYKIHTLSFMNVVSKLYKIINGCTTEEWKRIMPTFFWDKQQEDQRRRLASSYYRTENCDSDSE